MKAFRELAKSGIVGLVLISVTAGYLLGVRSSPDGDTATFVRHFFTSFVGILLLASGSSALNQIQEREIDARMPRTKGRPLPSARISLRVAWGFVLSCLAGGLALLAWQSPLLVTLGVAAVLLYNGFYTLWWKKHWAFAAVPGAIPGALPILMGHAAAVGRIEAAGIYLFAILFFWQMPHFWVLAIRYREDYAKGGFPTLPVAHGPGVTVEHIVIWCLGYVALMFLSPLFLGTGLLHLACTLVLALKLLYELWVFARKPSAERDRAWLRLFLWINLSLVFFLASVLLDIWGGVWGGG